MSVELDTKETVPNLASIFVLTKSAPSSVAAAQLRLKTKSNL